MAASSNLKASGFATAVMQMNFSKLVTIYFTSTFSVPVGIFVFVFSKHKLSCYISTALWLRKYGVFDFSGDHTTEVPRDFLGGAPSFWFSTLPSFRGHGPCECGDKTFLICHVTTWLMCHVTFWVGSLILSQHLAKFGLHRLCESRNTTFFICHRTTKLKCHVTFWMVTPHPKSPIG